MYVERNFYIGFRDIDFKNNLKIKSTLSYLEDIAGYHSNLSGYGLLDIPKTKKSWVLINWKVEYIRRPHYSENLKIKTWSSAMDKIHALRDFYVYDEDGNIVIKATSKWVLLDIETKRIVKLTDEVMNAYTIENEHVFNDEIEKLDEPKTFIDSCNVKVTKSMTDVNGHVHNLNYIDFASQIIPDVILENAKNLEVLYKKEIRGEVNVKCLYAIDNNYHYAVIKSEDESVTHAIIRIR